MRPKFRPRKQQQGLLVVTGHDQITIPLKDFPFRLECFFNKKPRHTPCDPHGHRHSDVLFWEIRRFYRNHRHNYKLVIKWRVREIREITWIAYY